MRVVDVLCLAAAIGGAAYVYNVKHHAELAHEDRRTLEREIGALSRDVGLLEADLAALEQPARLQSVVAGLSETLALEPIGSQHYIRLDDIPFRSELAASLPEGELEDGGAPETTASIEVPGQLDLLLEQLIESPAPSVADVSPPAPLHQPVDSIGALLESAVEGPRQ